MEPLLDRLSDLLSTDRLVAVLQAVVLLAAGWLVARLVRSGLGRALASHLDAPRRLLFQRAAFYTVFGLFLASALNQLGFSLGVILGAAGILSVAAGFASQTSASNLISGLFLVFERPFEIGDLVRVGDTEGEVLSIDLLSVKLRTYDNLFVRIPNETLLKAEVTTLTRFPIRRIDLAIGVAYKEDLERVHELLLEVARRDPECLEEPEPLFLLRGYGASSIDIQFSVWVPTSRFVARRTALYAAIKKAFDEAGIEIPFPHLSLYAGTATAALPLRLERPPEGEQQEEAKVEGAAEP